MSAKPIYQGNDIYVTLSDFWNRQSGAYDTGATVTCRIVDKNGDDVEGETWPVSMPYVSGTNAKYEIVITKGLTLVLNTEYRVQITAVSGSLDAFWDIPVVFKRRLQ